MELILKSKNQFIGDWDLSKLDIVAVDIPPSEVRDLTSTTNSSAGVLKKFNVSLEGKDIYIKSGLSAGKLFNIRQPIIERIARNSAMMKLKRKAVTFWNTAKVNHSAV